MAQKASREKVRGYRVGTCQLQDIQGDTAKAMRIIESHVSEADDNEVDILCFPECFLQGYTLDKEITKKRAFIIGSPEFQKLIQPLARYNVAAIIGIIEKDNDEYFNTAVVIYKGKVAGKYRKVHLFEENFQPGKEYPIFTIKGLRFGINICYDARFSEGAKELAQKGAEIIFYPLNNRLPREKAISYREKHLPNLIDRAKETKRFIVSSDVIADEKEYLAYGCTAIVNPEGKLVSRVKELQSSMLITEIPIT